MKNILCGLKRIRICDSKRSKRGGKSSGDRTKGGVSRQGKKKRFGAETLSPEEGGGG